MQTHTISLEDDGLLRKRYKSWSRREPQHEWAALHVVSAATRDLVPRPVAADLEGDPPWVSMTTLPGRSLDGSLSAAQLDGLAAALQELWSVPADGLRQLAPASPADLHRVHDSLLTWRGSGVVDRARARAADWLAGPLTGQQPARYGGAADRPDRPRAVTPRGMTARAGPGAWGRPAG